VSDFLYTTGFAELTGGSVDWASSNWRVSLVNRFLYAADASDVDLDAIPPAAILATGNLPNPVVVGDAYTSDDVTLTGAAASMMGHALILYRWVGAPTGSTLVAHLDSVPLLPCAPDGDPLTLVWPHGPEKIFNDAGEFGQWSAVILGWPSDIDGPCSNPAGISLYGAF
jgi:hypothetical protein